jgi:hypothetical protein
VIFAGVVTAVELLTAILWPPGYDAPHVGGFRQFEGQLNNAASARDRQPQREWTDTDRAGGSRSGSRCLREFAISSQ